MYACTPREADGAATLAHARASHRVRPPATGVCQAHPLSPLRLRQTDIPLLSIWSGYVGRKRHPGTLGKRAATHLVHSRRHACMHAPRRHGGHWCRTLTGLFASTSAVVMAYVGAISRTAQQRTERISFINAVIAASYIIGPTLGGLLHGISTMVRAACCTLRAAHAVHLNSCRAVYYTCADTYFACCVLRAVCCATEESLADHHDASGLRPGCVDVYHACCMLCEVRGACRRR